MGKTNQSVCDLTALSYVDFRTVHQADSMYTNKTEKRFPKTQNLYIPILAAWTKDCAGTAIEECDEKEIFYVNFRTFLDLRHNFRYNSKETLKRGFYYGC